MSKDPSVGTSASAQIGLGVLMLAFAAWTLIAVPGGTSPRGIPMWILGVLLVPGGIWVIVRTIRSLRANK